MVALKIWFNPKPHLQHVDGVMLGRAAYHNPTLLWGVDQQIFGDDTPPHLT